jgi:hypothetical protein
MKLSKVNSCFGQSSFRWFDAFACTTPPVVHPYNRPPLFQLQHAELYFAGFIASRHIMLWNDFGEPVRPCPNGSSMRAFRRAFLSEGHGTAKRESLPSAGRRSWRTTEPRPAICNVIFKSFLT